MTDIGLNENSGVDHPAHLVEGWIAMKARDPSLSPEMAVLFAKAEAETMGVTLSDADIEAIEKGVLPPVQGATTMALTEEIRKALPPEVVTYLEDVESRLEKATETEEALAKAASNPHKFVGDDDDCGMEGCAKSKSADIHTDFGKAAEPIIAVTPEEAQRQEFAKALEEMPPAARELFVKAQRESAEQGEMLKRLHDEREDAHFATMTKSIAHLPGVTPEATGPVLRKAATADAAAFDDLFTLLKAADSALVGSGTFEALGSSVTAEGSGMNSTSNLDAVAKGLMEKDPTLAYDDAMTKAVADNPDVYRQHRTEDIRRQNYGA